MAKRIYTAFFTGSAGTSVGVFLIGDGVIVGADIGGLVYDGQLVEAADGALQGLVQFRVPAGGQLITGLKTEVEQKITTEVRLPVDFGDGKQVVRIDTPTGPVNAKFEFVREVQ